MKNIAPFIFLMLCTTSFGGRIEYLTCDGIYNQATDLVVDVSDCEDGRNCTLAKGSTYYLTTTFKLPENIKALQIRILGVMGRVRLPYMGHKFVCPEATTEDGINCDPEFGLLASQTYSHVKDFPVRNMYPQITMKARVEFFTGSRSLEKNTLICFEIPIKIVAQEPENNEV